MRQQYAKQTGVAILCFIALAGAYAGSFGIATPLNEVPFLDKLPMQVGERLTFDVKLGMLSAGAQSLQVVGEIKDGGERMLELQSSSQPSSVLDRIYHFRDRKTSVVSATTLLPRRYEKDIEDGSYRGRFIVDFDRVGNRASVWKDGAPQEDVEISPFVHDELSMIYFLRSKRLKIGDSYEYTFFTGKQMHDVKVDVKSRAYVDAPEPLGKVAVYRLEASDGFVIWITADEYRIPVRIEAPAKVFGKLVANLKRCEGVRGLQTRP